MSDYAAFIEAKTHLGNSHGFEPLFMPDFLFPFQRALVDWSVRKGRAAVMADTGLGKSPMQLVWAQNVVEKTCKPVLILTPLAVGPQTVREGEKFGIQSSISRDGKVAAQITITNYQNLHKFDWKEFSGVACDESGILKNFDGQFRQQIVDFMRKLPYRSLWTATAAPNDYFELGNSSEALGDLGYIDMLARFFKSTDGTYAQGGSGGGRFNSDRFAGKFRFRGHAERDFWRWVCSWARAVRKPSDIGFPDDGYILPPLNTVEHIIKTNKPNPDYLFDMPAIGLKEQRQERRRTINERCELAASLIGKEEKSVIAWCHLNEEGHLLEKLISDAVEVEGNDSDEYKEEMVEAFQKGQIRALVSKPVILGFGLNLQMCHHQTFFPSHSFEQWYQAIRRSWRFGQKETVRIDMIASEGERGVLANLNRKHEAADKMYSRLVELMNNELRIEKTNQPTKQPEIPKWL